MFFSGPMQPGTSSQKPGSSLCFLGACFLFARGLHKFSSNGDFHNFLFPCPYSQLQGLVTGESSQLSSLRGCHWLRKVTLPIRGLGTGDFLVTSWFGGKNLVSLSSSGQIQKAISA